VLQQELDHAVHLAEAAGQSLVLRAKCVPSGTTARSTRFLTTLKEVIEALAKVGPKPSELPAAAEFVSGTDSAELRAAVDAILSNYAKVANASNVCQQTFVAVVSSDAGGSSNSSDVAADMLASVSSVSDYVESSVKGKAHYLSSNERAIQKQQHVIESVETSALGNQGGAASLDIGDDWDPLRNSEINVIKGAASEPEGPTVAEPAESLDASINEMLAEASQLLNGQASHVGSSPSVSVLTTGKTAGSSSSFQDLERLLDSIEGGVDLESSALFRNLDNLAPAEEQQVQAEAAEVAVEEERTQVPVDVPVEEEEEEEEEAAVETAQAESSSSTAVDVTVTLTPTVAPIVRVDSDFVMVGAEYVHLFSS